MEPMEPTNVADSDPGDCPTGTCGTDTYAVYDPRDEMGPMDISLGLPDPATALTIEQIVAMNGDSFTKFWLRFMDAFENLYGKEERLKTAALFYPGEGRAGHYEIRFNPVGVGYSASYGWTDHVSSNPWPGESYEPAIFATNLGNIFRDVDIIDFSASVDPNSLSDDELMKLAQRLKQALQIEQDFAAWGRIAFDVAVGALTVLALVSGVGAVVAATSIALRAAAILVLALEISDGVAVGTGYLGYNQGQGVNPLEEAAAFLGGTLDDENGEKAARTAYSVLNIAVGLKGKWRALSIVPVGLNYGPGGGLMGPADATVVEDFTRAGG
ncbi:hypothetical protein [Jannaschia pohangensis]|uniref:Uncharacterized protein n=1 Tax=Jannaschia pohangensis TaxID=390807 RepID=A0A1I3P3U9_9RHOB|nr:hypothetical protein [Jannaschia pohangensis]SFJ16017.1 hypothetical protein SAMN04488095_2333 [Jannaschia pohangensis]